MKAYETNQGTAVIKNSDNLKEKLKSEVKQGNEKIKRKFFDIVFLVGILCCVVPCLKPELTNHVSILLLGCICISFFDKNFYLYTAIFMYMRYTMLIGDTPVFRLYSYLVVARFLLGIFKTRFRLAYLPALFVFFLHCVFAVPMVTTIRQGLNVLVDCSLMYIVLLQVLTDKDFLRRYLYVFIIGGAISGFYGWVNPDYTMKINVSGAGAQKVTRNFGVLTDTNFAGLFYSLCVMCAVLLKGIPTWLRVILAVMYTYMLLQTASLSAILMLIVLSCFMIILKYRGKAFFILTVAFVALTILISILLTIPQFRQLEAIAGLIIRVEEKLSYIPRGRWDLVTTDRAAIWGEAYEVFMAKSLWGKLIGGSSITVMVHDSSLLSGACHNSYIQSLINFGILGTLLIYLPLIGTFLFRMYKHFTTKQGYFDEDIRILQMIFVFAFITFGMSVDFYIDWAFMLFYFI